MSTTNILDLNNRVGELAESYPASKVMMSDGVTSVEEAMGNMRMAKLWENPSPSSSFAARDITGLLMSGYDFFVVTTQNGTCVFPATNNGVVCLSGTSDNVNYIFRRMFTPDVSQNKVTVTDCIGINITDGSSATFNRIAVPLTIYGIMLT